jgi:hypothetical protein
LQDPEQQQQLLPPLPEHQQQLLSLGAGQSEQVHTAAELTFAGHLQPAATESLTATHGSFGASAQCESPQAKRVLQQIQSALHLAAPDGAGCWEACVAAAANAAPCTGNTSSVADAGPVTSTSAGADSFGLPPEVAAAVDVGDGVCSAGISAAPLAARIEALRCSLEESLGQEVMMMAYRCGVTQMMCLLVDSIAPKLLIILTMILHMLSPM